MIDMAIERYSENEDMNLHIVYVGDKYNKNETVLHSLVLDSLKKYNIDLGPGSANTS